MKRSRKEIQIRQQALLHYLSENPGATPAELAEIFSVSPVTLHRDLRHLEEHHLVETYYGGVRLLSAETAAEDLLICQEAVARYAASFVEDDDLIFLNTSSTALMMLPYIEAKNVTVITNNGNAIKHNYRSNLSIILTGGELRHPKESMVGDYAVRTLMGISARKCFLGCSGLSLERGMTTINFNEVSLNELMVERTVGDTFILCDHTKIQHDENYTSCSLEKIGHIITDSRLDPAVASLYRKQGLDLHTAPIERRTAAQ